MQLVLFIFRYIHVCHYSWNNNGCFHEAALLTIDSSSSDPDAVYAWLKQRRILPDRAKIGDFVDFYSAILSIQQPLFELP